MSNSLVDQFQDACKSKQMDVVKDIIANEGDKLPSKDIQFGFKWACLCGNKEMVEYLLENTNDKLTGADYEFGIWGACKNGFMDIVSLLFPKIDNPDKELRSLYSRACADNNLEMAKYLLSMMETNSIASYAFGVACTIGNTEIADYIEQNQSESRFYYRKGTDFCVVSNHELNYAEIGICRSFGNLTVYYNNREIVSDSIDAYQNYNFVKL